MWGTDVSSPHSGRLSSATEQDPVTAQKAGDTVQPRGPGFEPHHYHTKQATEVFSKKLKDPRHSLSAIAKALLICQPWGPAAVRLRPWGSHVPEGPDALERAEHGLDTGGEGFS